MLSRGEKKKWKFFFVIPKTTAKMEDIFVDSFGER